MKPHYRLHFHWFDGKTPLWWVVKVRPYTNCGGGWHSCRNAIEQAAQL